MNIKISPSILSADLCSLGRDIKLTEEAGADYLHFDVMDGVFVNNISYGIPVLQSVRKNTDLVLDVHLMITEPHRFIRAFADSGADIITFHSEAESDIEGTVKLIRECGKKAAVAIKPATPVESIYKYINDVDMILIMTVEPGFGGQGFIYETVDKISALRKYAESRGIDIDIQVDGGINAETADIVRKAGANVLVAGSYFYKAADKEKAVGILRGNV